MAKALNIPGEAGLLVQRVADNSPAADIGLKAGTVHVRTASRNMIIGGDVVLEVQGRPVSSDQSVRHEIHRSIFRINLDRDFSLTVLREGRTVKLTLPMRNEGIELRESIK